MVIERQNYERFFHLADKNRRQVMKIPRTRKYEWLQILAELPVETLNRPSRSDESQRRPDFSSVNPSGRFKGWGFAKIPGIVEREPDSPGGASA
jgi:hypothetical protein